MASDDHAGQVSIGAITISTAEPIAATGDIHQEQGAFIGGQARVEGPVTGVNQGVINLDDQAYMVRGLPNPYLGLRSFTYADRDSYAGIVGRSARLWTLGDKPHATTLRGHTNWIVGAMFSPDSQRIVTASWDHTARLYIVGPYLTATDNLLAVAPCLVGRGLTPDEIKDFQVGSPRFDFAQRQCPPVLPPK
ncbi:MAG: hypothetical protein H0X37_16760 [Herpetosiphonaceae bacterium]|nr:hypothetical protein [Herpetosiphonaceae bacterium]